MTDQRTLNTKLNLFTGFRGVTTGRRRQTNSVPGKKKNVFVTNRIHKNV